MPFPLLLHRLLSFGRKSELLALDYVRSLGFRVAAAPYRTKTGEVDIVAWDGDMLVFIEVKARRNGDPPENAVGSRKRERIIRAARAYISRYRHHEVSFRFDILSVTSYEKHRPEFRLHRDAFRMYN
jgi:putative endonuclease